jgi:hypothetical protein
MIIDVSAFKKPKYIFREIEKSKDQSESIMIKNIPLGFFRQYLEFFKRLSSGSVSCTFHSKLIDIEVENFVLENSETGIDVLDFFDRFTFVDDDWYGSVNKIMSILPKIRHLEIPYGSMHQRGLIRIHRALPDCIIILRGFPTEEIRFKNFVFIIISEKLEDNYYDMRKVFFDKGGSIYFKERNTLVLEMNNTNMQIIGDFEIFDRSKTRISFVDTDDTKKPVSLSYPHILNKEKIKKIKSSKISFINCNNRINFEIPITVTDLEFISDPNNVSVRKIPVCINDDLFPLLRNFTGFGLELKMECENLDTVNLTDCILEKAPKTVKTIATLDSIIFDFPKISSECVEILSSKIMFPLELLGGYHFLSLKENRGREIKIEDTQWRGRIENNENIIEKFCT